MSVLRGLTVALLAAVALTLPSACGGSDPTPDGPPSSPAGGSTMEATIVDRDGDGILERGPAESPVDRTDLAPVSEPAGAALARIGQLTDAHVRDEESPARVAFLDRLGGSLSSTFRPQESLSPQVLDAAVRGLNGQHPDVVLQTGDLADNAQEDELALGQAILTGGRVDPDSGAAGYQGVQSASNPDPLIFRPDLDAPQAPGLLTTAQRPFTAAGLDAPWLPVMGNHDVLLQGEVPPTPATDRFATGGRLVTELDPAAQDLVDADSPSAGVAELLAAGVPGTARTVAADPTRRAVDADALVRRLGAGHTLRAPDRLDYVADIGADVRVVVLDDIERSAARRNALSGAQLTWLEQQVQAAGARWVLVVSHVPLGSVGNGPVALAMLARHRQVVASIAGHTHHNRLTPYAGPGGGLWQIETASLADWPMQTRMLQLRRTPDGVVLQTWTVDGAGTGLAATARALAFLDAQGGRPQNDAGARADRNARLFLRR